jgi:hypothetical protein
MQRACISLGGILGLVFTLSCAVYGQTNSTNYYAPQAGEYAPAGNLPGDQAMPCLSMSLSGGFLVWQDNITDGSGLGISAVRLDNTFSPTGGNFRVNVQGTNDQENPRVALLQNGGAAFVWQSGPLSFQHIMARFLSSSNLWVNSNDIQVNTATNYQINPALAVLTNGNVVVVWGSFGQDNPDGFQGVYGQILSPVGQKIGGEFQVNQFTPFNQRTPAVAAFPNGNFIVAWVSEQERFSAALLNDGNGDLNTNATFNSVDIYARLYNSAGTPQGNEFLVNTATNVCANPSVAVAPDGTYIIAWSQKDTVVVNNSWDVYARQFSSAGVGGAATLLNSQQYGDQYAPELCSLGTTYLAVWTSMGQDGSREGVFGQLLNANGSHAGGEFRVNTTVLNQQMFPTVSSDGQERFLVAWSSFTGLTYGLDLEAQRYASTLQPLTAPNPPYVIALDSYSLSVSWPALAGFDVSYYELFVDGSTTPEIVTNDMWSDLGFNPSSTHTFQLAYALADGRVSPLSATASGTTWAADNLSYPAGRLGQHSDGLPDDWETLYYGTNRNNWPQLGTFTQLAPGVTVGEVFEWGANPTNSNTWLKQWITSTPEGLFLNWNTVPGGIYQVLTTTDLQNWTNLGPPRFEAGTTDSLYLGRSSGGYYQIVRNRY